MKFLSYPTILILLVSSCVRSEKKVTKEIKNETIYKVHEALIDSAFNFSYKESTDFYNSKNGTFIRNYLRTDTTIKVMLTKIELNRIEKLYIKNHLDTLPKNYKPNCRINITPSFEEVFEINYKGIKQIFTFNNDYNCDDKKTQEIVSNIKVFRESVVKILREKRDIKELKNSDMMFL